MLERTNAITNEVLEPVAFVLAYPTYRQVRWSILFIRHTLYLAHCSGFIGDHDRLQLVWMAAGD